MTNLICIVCPRGCHITVDDNGNVSGYTCNRGKAYALNEISHPTRMLTSTVKVLNGDIERCPVVTSLPIPKEKIFDVMTEINKVTVEAPINIKDIIIDNVLGLGIDIVASRNIIKKD